MATWYDGRSARAWPAEVSVEGGDLVIRTDQGVRLWPLKGLKVETAGDSRRLSHPIEPDARLTIPADEWAALAPALAGRIERARRGELRLVLGLAAAGLSVAALLFLGVPFAAGPLARVTDPKVESAFGEVYATQMTAAFPLCEGAHGQALMAWLGDRLHEASDSPLRFQVQAVEAPFMNAFALPGGTILITDDLIEEATPEELAAVVAHEAAHVERRHAMASAYRSAGLGLVLDLVVGGGSGAGQQAVLLAGSLTDMSYNRAAEAEADTRGQELLHAAGLSSKGMASFFDKLSAEESREAATVREYLSTHPVGANRRDAAARRERDGDPPFNAEEWKVVQKTCDGDPRGRLPVVIFDRAGP